MLSAVTAAMQMAVTPLQAIAAASLDGQVGALDQCLKEITKTLVSNGVDCSFNEMHTAQFFSFFQKKNQNAVKSPAHFLAMIC